MSWLQAALSVDWKRVSLKKVSLQGILGAIAVFGTMKAHGADNTTAAVAAAVSGLTSAYAGGVDPSKAPASAE